MRKSSQGICSWGLLFRKETMETSKFMKTFKEHNVSGFFVRIKKGCYIQSTVFNTGFYGSTFDEAMNKLIEYADERKKRQ